MENINTESLKLFQQHTKLFNLDNVTSKNDNKIWSYRVLVVGPSGSRKTKALFDLIQQDINIIDKIYLYAKDLEEPKYQFLTKRRENAVLFFNTQILWMIFTIILMITTSKEREKF